MPAGASNLLHKTINDYQNVTDFSIIVHEVSRTVQPRKKIKATFALYEVIWVFINEFFVM